MKLKSAKMTLLLILIQSVLGIVHLTNLNVASFTSASRFFACEIIFTTICFFQCTASDFVELNDALVFVMGRIMVLLPSMMETMMCLTPGTSRGHYQLCGCFTFLTGFLSLATAVYMVSIQTKERASRMEHCS